MLKQVMEKKDIKPEEFKEMATSIGIDLPDHVIENFGKCYSQWQGKG